MKQREFWIIPRNDENEYNDVGSVALSLDEYTERAKEEAIHVREILSDSTQLPTNYIRSIDWAKIWLEYSEANKNSHIVLQKYREQLQELVEKALRGQE